MNHQDPVEAPAFPPRAILFFDDDGYKRECYTVHCPPAAVDRIIEVWPNRHEYLSLTEHEAILEKQAFDFRNAVSDLEAEVAKLKAENERLRTFWERIGEFTFKSRSRITSRKPTHVSLEIALIEKELKESP